VRAIARRQWPSRFAAGLFTYSRCTDFRHCPRTDTPKALGKDTGMSCIRSFCSDIASRFRRFSATETVSAKAIFCFPVRRSWRRPFDLASSGWRLAAGAGDSLHSIAQPGQPGPARGRNPDPDRHVCFAGLLNATARTFGGSRMCRCRADVAAYFRCQPAQLQAIVNTNDSHRNGYFTHWSRRVLARRPSLRLARNRHPACAPQRPFVNTT
jgi:hypothetical protein